MDNSRLPKKLKLPCCFRKCCSSDSFPVSIMGSVFPKLSQLKKKVNTNKYVGIYYLLILCFYYYYLSIGTFTISTLCFPIINFVLCLKGCLKKITFMKMTRSPLPTLILTVNVQFLLLCGSIKRYLSTYPHNFFLN